MWTGSSVTAFRPAGRAAPAKYTHHTWSEVTHNSQIAARAPVPRFLVASTGFCQYGRRSSLVRKIRLSLYKWGGSHKMHPVYGIFAAFPGRLTAICAKLTTFSLEWSRWLTNLDMSGAETLALSRGHDQISLSGSSPVGLQWYILLIMPALSHQWKTQGKSNCLVWTKYSKK